MKKSIFIILFLCSASFSRATTYYFSSGGNDGATNTIITPWLTFNNHSYASGDSVLFKSGDTLYQSITTNTSLYFGRYGIGSNPVISGFATLNNWISVGNHLFYDSIALPTNPLLNIVEIDGVLQPAARYPKSGYLTYRKDGFSSGSSAIDLQSALSFDATGSIAVIKKIRQVTDKSYVDYVSGSVIGLSTYDYGGTMLNNQVYDPNDYFGVFFECSLPMVTQDRDWSYSYQQPNKLYVYFNDTIANHRIRASNILNLVSIDNGSNISFNSIDFEGAGYNIFKSNGINNISFNNCNFSRSFNALNCDNGTYNLKIHKCNFVNLTNNGVFIPQMVSNTLIDSCSFYNVGFIAGMGGSGDGQQQGIWVDGDSTIIRGNILKSIGYHGIVCRGSKILVENNVVDSFGFVKDDAGGFYSFDYPNNPRSADTIRKNVFKNGFNVGGGKPTYDSVGQVSGIYIDASCNNYVSYNNTITNTWSGIFNINNFNNSFYGNNITNSMYGFHVLGTDSSLSNIQFHNNKINLNPSQIAMYMEYTVGDRTSTFLTSNYNTFNFSTVLSPFKVSTSKNLKQWQATYSLDVNSTIGGLGVPANAAFPSKAVFPLKP